MPVSAAVTGSISTIIRTASHTMLKSSTCNVILRTHALILTRISGGSRLGIALAAARERGMLGGDISDDSAAGAASPSFLISPMREVASALQGSADVTPLQSPGGVGDNDMFANFV